MALQITDVVAQFGAYYLNQGQNLQRLYTLLRSATTTESMFTPVNTDDTLWRAAKAIFTRVVQPFQKTFTPLASVVVGKWLLNKLTLRIQNSTKLLVLEIAW